VRIEVKFQDDVAVMRLSGKFLAGSDGPFLRQKAKDLFEAGTRRLILDFSEVPYIDSTGLGFLAGTHASAQNAGASLVLANLNPHVRKILDGVQLSKFFVIADSELEALAKVRQAGPPFRDSGPASGKGPRGKKRSSSPEV
jgi:anti-anti-sigma factor